MKKEVNCCQELLFFQADTEGYIICNRLGRRTEFEALNFKFGFQVSLYSFSLLNVVPDLFLHSQHLIYEEQVPVLLLQQGHHRRHSLVQMKE